MKDFQHDNVLGLVGLTFNPQGIPLVVLPLMKNGDLKSFFKKAPKVLVISNFKVDFYRKELSYHKTSCLRFRDLQHYLYILR